jgi:predicted transcriptional regulator
MNKDQLEFLAMGLLPKILPCQRKTITSLLKDYGKSIYKLPRHYRTSHLVYKALLSYPKGLTIKELRAIINPKLFTQNKYSLQFLLLRGLIDRDTRRKEYVYFVTSDICTYNHKYYSILSKRW